MPVSELVIQYEDKIRSLQVGLDQARSQGALASGALVLATAAFLILSVSAIRRQAPLLMPLLMLPAIAVLGG